MRQQREKTRLGITSPQLRPGKRPLAPDQLRLRAALSCRSAHPRSPILVAAGSMAQTEYLRVRPKRRPRVKLARVIHPLQPLRAPAQALLLSSPAHVMRRDLLEDLKLCGVWWRETVQRRF